MDGVPAERAVELAAALREAGRAAEGATAFDVTAVVAGVLGSLGLGHVDPVAVRRAMCAPAAALALDPDAAPFLEALANIGVKRVIVSNAVWPGADEYRRNFAASGVSHLIDAVVSSVDTIVRRPDRRIFQIALAAAGDPLPFTCVMVGDRERPDILAARALGMLTVRIARDGAESAADAVVPSLGEAAEVIAAWDREPPARGVVTTEVGPLAVTLANDSEDERHVRDLLASLLGEYDVSRYIFTGRVIIQDLAIHHSHPVLTLGTRFSVRTKIGLLATFLHEQLHWHLEPHREATLAAIEELRALYPEVPVGREAGGAANERSTYLHLVVNWLEHRALAAVVGEEEAVATTRAQAVYRWIYARVLEDGARIGEVVRGHGLSLD